MKRGRFNSGIRGRDGRTSRGGCLEKYLEGLDNFFSLDVLFRRIHGMSVHCHAREMQAFTTNAVNITSPSTILQCYDQGCSILHMVLILIQRLYPLQGHNFWYFISCELCKSNSKHHTLISLIPVEQHIDYQHLMLCYKNRVLCSTLSMYSQLLFIHKSKCHFYFINLLEAPDIFAVHA